LCPYGIFSAYVNHNQSLANVKIQWADPSKSNHKPDWLNLTIAQLEKHESAGLAMELVATRDIEPDEEIFLDYGDEWEAAWQTHLSEWPYWYDKDYVSSFQLNEEEIIKTEFEQIAAPYPQNVELRINLGFDRPRSDWLPYWRDGTLPKYIMKEDDYTQKAEVITREHDLDGNIWYDVLLQQEETKKLRKLPRQAITFFDRPHTSDIHLLNAFRHDIRAPNELFPEIWKNVIPIDYEPTEKSCNAEETCMAP